MSLSEKIMYSTVLLECEYKDGKQGSGTGFVMNLCFDKDTNKIVPVVITNKHVVNNAKTCKFSFCKANNNEEPIDSQCFDITLKDVEWLSHPSQYVDLCCLPLAQILNMIHNKDEKIFYIPFGTDLIPPDDIINDLFALEDVVMAGYPIGISDNYNHKPILRRGCTATHIKLDYQNRKEFLIDIACYPGSSGSPIFILNEGAYRTKKGLTAGSRIYFIGILYAAPVLSGGKLSIEAIPNNTLDKLPINLGAVIKSNQILALESMLLKIK